MELTKNAKVTFYVVRPNRGKTVWKTNKKYSIIPRARISYLFEAQGTMKVVTKM